MVKGVGFSRGILWGEPHCEHMCTMYVGMRLESISIRTGRLNPSRLFHPKSPSD